MLHVETVLPDTLALLKRIQAMPELSAMRLVGGTALALLLGHRKSVDLDFSRIDSGEDSRTQFKREAIGVNDLAKELAAFANAEGGVIHRIGGKTVLAVIVPEGVSKPYADKHGSFWTKNGPDKRRVTAREELQRMLQKSLLIHADELPVEKTSVRDIDLGLSAVNARKYNLLVRKFSGDALSRRADVVSLLGLKPAMASRFISKLVSLKLIVPVSGRGKGAYRVFGGVAQ